MHESTKILENGDIYFMYRLRVEEDKPHHLEEIQRFYFVLKGRERESFLSPGYSWEKKNAVDRASGYRVCLC